MKKILKQMICLSMLLFSVGCSDTNVTYEYDDTYLLEFFFVESCSMCQQFKSEGIPYLEEEFGEALDIQMIDLDDENNKERYDAFIDRIDTSVFEGSYYGMAPMVSLDGYFAKLGIYKDEYKYLVKDIHNAINGNELSVELSYNRALFIEAE